MSDAATAAHEGHDGHDAPHVNYMAKAYWLVGLTLAEVGAAVALQGDGKTGLRLGALSVLALWKAGIVGAYYMHLQTEPRALKAVALFPLALIVVLCTAVLTDGHWLGYAATR
jgi:cytochrome c oxidase subunit IV